MNFLYKTPWGFMLVKGLKGESYPWLGSYNIPLQYQVVTDTKTNPIPPEGSTSEENLLIFSIQQFLIWSLQ